MLATNRPRKTLRLSTAIILLCLWLVLLLLLGYNRQNLIDWWRLKHYQAPPAVAQLATDDTMTAQARKIFYVNDPQLQAKASFTDCTQGSEKAAVLGCYHSGQAGIFVLTVSDPRLNGVEQVTAAHEMLHAAYDRLSSKQKNKIDGLLENYYQHDLHDPVIQAQMAGYQQSEPDSVVDEMHSVFGTEVGDLPAALEQYYRQYFTDRAKVVGYYQQYQGEFTSRQATIKTDDAQLTSWKAEINSRQTQLKAQYASLQSMQAQLDSYKQRGDITDYNAGVAGYNQAVDAYDSQLTGLRQLVGQYDQLVQSLNSIVFEVQQLTSEISTQAPTVNK